MIQIFSLILFRKEQMTDTDSDVINKIKKGDTEEFRKIIDLYRNKSYSLALRILKTHNDAEDCVQESFIKLYNAIVNGLYESKSKLSTYLYAIVYNTAVDTYKKHSKRSFNITSIDITESNFREGDELVRNFDYVILKSEDGSPYSKLVKKEIAGIIRNYVDSIPEHYSVILNMFYVNELSYEEIGGILKLPEGTVKNRIFRAKEKLKQIILKNYSQEEILEYI